MILAEDEPDVRDFLVRAFSRLQPNAQITAVSSGSEALEIFSRCGAHLIVSDHLMPNMSGLELLLQVRAVSAVPVVLISADVTIESRARVAGVSEFQLKPIGIDRLRDIVTRFLP